MLNWIWLSLILASVLWAAFTGQMEALNRSILDSAISAIDLLIGLLGPMVFFLGVMNVAREGGLLLAIARKIAPLMRRLFPEVPEDHPAMAAMIMNMAANLLGMGNAATPFGLKAMVELEKLNRHSGVATNAMVLFLAINTSSVTLLPTGTMAVRAGEGSLNPAAIFPTTLFATLCSTLVAISAFFLLRNLRFYRRDAAAADATAETPTDAEPEELPDIEVLPEPPPPPHPAIRLLIAGFWVALGVALFLHVRARMAELSLAEILMQDVLASWLLAALVAFLLLVGLRGRVRVYEAAVEGGKEGMAVALRIAPFLVAILVAVGMLRASGLIAALVALLDPLLRPLGFPSEALPMALLKPLSGSGSFGVMSEILKTHGPDSFVGQVASTIQGSTETTFYVLAIYLGAARVRDARHSLPACLMGDLAGVLGAVAACHWFFG